MVALHRDENAHAVNGVLTQSGAAPGCLQPRFCVRVGHWAYSHIYEHAKKPPVLRALPSLYTNTKRRLVCLPSSPVPASAPLLCLALMAGP
jgi:hypothetical protein